MIFNYYLKKELQGRPKRVWQLKKGDWVALEGTTHLVDCLFNYKVGPYDIYSLVFSDGTKIENISEHASFEVLGRQGST